MWKPHGFNSIYNIKPEQTAAASRERQKDPDIHVHISYDTKLCMNLYIFNNDNKKKWK